MGIFDSVMVPCPNCGRNCEFQTKVGDPYMQRFTLESASSEQLWDILNGPDFCSGCRRWFAIVDPSYPSGLPPRPKAVAVLLKPQEETTEQLNKGQYYWPYDKPFSFDDLEELQPNPQSNGEA